MLRLMLALLIAIAPSGAIAENSMPPRPDGLVPTYYQNCIDEETGQKGQCLITEDEAGNAYLLFGQNGAIMTIRQLTSNGKTITLWTASK
jgi:hypothetical protein